MANIRLGRADPPESEWPGREVDETDVAAACGDPRDWFDYEDRLHFHYLVKEYYERARKRVKDANRQVAWGQMVVAGKMGASKSVFIGSFALGRKDRGWGYLRGTPFFHYGGNWLYGRALDGTELYDAIERIPRNSILAMDEAHVAADGSVPNSRGNALIRQLSAGLRKKQGKFILITAKPDLLDRRIRFDCDTVVLPVKPAVEDDQLNDVYRIKRLPKNDLNNFCLCWHVWEDFPYQRMGDPEENGQKKKRRVPPLFIGPPDKTMTMHGNRVRAGYALTDSFIPVESGTAWEFGSAEQIAKSKEQRQKEAEEKQHINKVVGWILSTDPSRVAPVVSTAAIAGQAGVKAADANRILEGYFGAYPDTKNSKGWKFGQIQNIAELLFEDAA